MTTLLKLVLIISSVVFGLTLVAKTKDDGPAQRKTDRRVILVSGIFIVLSGLWLWIFGW